MLPEDAVCAICQSEEMPGPSGASEANARASSSLLTCRKCKEIVHPECLMNKIAGADSIRNSLYTDMWECPKCVANDGAINEEPTEDCQPCQCTCHNVENDCQQFWKQLHQERKLERVLAALNERTAQLFIRLNKTEASSEDCMLFWELLSAHNLLPQVFDILAKSILDFVKQLRKRFQVNSSDAQFEDLNIVNNTALLELLGVISTEQECGQNNNVHTTKFHFDPGVLGPEKRKKTPKTRKVKKAKLKDEMEVQGYKSLSVEVGTRVKNTLPLLNGEPNESYIPLADHIPEEAGKKVRSAVALDELRECSLPKNTLTCPCCGQEDLEDMFHLYSHLTLSHKMPEQEALKIGKDAEELSAAILKEETRIFTEHAYAVVDLPSSQSARLSSRPNPPNSQPEKANKRSGKQNEKILKKPALECMICSQTISDQRNLRSHLKEVHGSSPDESFGMTNLSMQVASLEFKLKTTNTADNLIKIGQFWCEECGLNYKTPSDLARHLLTHNKITKEIEKILEMRWNIFACDLCSKRFETHKPLLHHFKSTHNKLSTKDARAKMIEMFPDLDIPVICELCHLVLQSRSDYENHLLNLHCVITKVVKEMLAESFPESRASLAHSNTATREDDPEDMPINKEGQTAKPIPDKDVKPDELDMNILEQEVQSSLKQASTCMCRICFKDCEDCMHHIFHLIEEHSFSLQEAEAKVEEAYPNMVAYSCYLCSEQTSYLETLTKHLYATHKCAWLKLISKCSSLYPCASSTLGKMHNRSSVGPIKTKAVTSQKESEENKDDAEAVQKRKDVGEVPLEEVDGVSKVTKPSDGKEPSGKDSKKEKKKKKAKRRPSKEMASGLTHASVTCPFCFCLFPDMSTMEEHRLTHTSVVGVILLNDQFPTIENDGFQIDTK